MDDRDWTISAKKAIWLLGHADEAPPRERLRGMALQLRLWHYPPAGVHLSWSILLAVREYRAKKAIVREASWDPSRERKRAAGVDPDVRLRDLEFDWKDLSSYLEEAAGLRGEAASPMPPGKSSTGLEGSRSFAHVRLEWSGRGPRAWTPLVAWFERFRELLVRAFRERGQSY